MSFNERNPERGWGCVGRCLPDDAHDHFNITMRNGQSEQIGESGSYVQRIRENYETEELSAIMGRFYQAISNGGEQ